MNVNFDLKKKLRKAKMLKEFLDKHDVQFLQTSDGKIYFIHENCFEDIEKHLLNWKSEDSVPTMRSQRECTNCHKDKLIENGFCNCCGGKQ